MTDTIINTLVTALLGGGLIASVVEFIRARSERKKTEAEAEAVGIKTPAEVESMSVSTMRTALDSVIAANKEAHVQIASMREDFQAQITRLRQENEGVYRSTQIELGQLRQAFRSAENYISVLLNWIGEMLPGVHPPEREYMFTLDEPGWRDNDNDKE